MKMKPLRGDLVFCWPDLAEEVILVDFRDHGMQSLQAYGLRLVCMAHLVKACCKHIISPAWQAALDGASRVLC